MRVAGGALEAARMRESGGVGAGGRKRHFLSAWRMECGTRRTVDGYEWGDVTKMTRGGRIEGGDWPSRGLFEGMGVIAEPASRGEGEYDSEDTERQ